MNLGSDIRIKGAFFTHYKTLKLIKLVGYEGPFRLQQLWFFASEHRIDGDLLGMDDDDIALAAGWVGETSDFIGALVACRWLDGEPGCRQIHDFIENQPWVQKRAEKQRQGAAGGKKAAENMTDEQRAERSRKAAESRWKDANVMQTECKVNAKDTKHDAYNTKHAMLSPDQTRSRPDPDLKRTDRTDLSGPTVADTDRAVKKRKPEVESDQVKELFDLWAQVMDKKAPKFSPTRKRRIEWALREYGFERARLAIIGCASSAFNMGDNDRDKPFNDLELIFRNAEKFEAFEALGVAAKTSIDAETGKLVVQVNQPEGKSKGGFKPGCDQYGREYGVLTIARERGVNITGGIF